MGLVSDEEKEIAAKKYLKKNVHCPQKLGKWKPNNPEILLFPSQKNKEQQNDPN